MRASHTCHIVLDNIPTAVKRAHIFPGLHNKALISLGQFCDNGYEVQLTKDKIYINHITNNELSIEGNRDRMTKMWTINIDNMQRPNKLHSNDKHLKMNNVYKFNKKKDIVTYLHKAAYSPVKSTWIKAINSGFFTTWPGLTADLVEKHLDKAPATTQGHLRQIRQNLRST